QTLQMDKVLVAAGELYRLFTVALVHAPLQQDPFHLIFNMYALWIAGPFIERMYGPWRLLVFYAVFVLGASLMSFAISTAPEDQFAVGASGGIFGLFGLLVAALAVHRPALGSTRGLLGQLVALIGLNLLLGATTSGIDNMAHVGGLLTGLWIGLQYPPTNVPSLGSMWLRPGTEPGTSVPILGRGGMLAVHAIGLVGLAVAFAVLWQLGVKAWS
ncbi:MAG TPA: rhomboid family intramembrane serine protease, partial [Candidatus Limnocylindrales bacterium]